MEYLQKKVFVAAIKPGHIAINDSSDLLLFRTQLFASI